MTKTEGDGIAREAGIHASQLFRWRQRLHGHVAARFASQTLEVPPNAAEARPDAAAVTALPMSPGVIEIEFGTGTRLHICGPVDTPIVAAVVQALADCRRH